MEQAITIAAVLLVALIGFFKVRRGLINVTEKREFAETFATKLRAYIGSRGKDMEAFAWMIHRSNRMQHQMGQDGVFSVYRPPFANYGIRNYQIIHNMLPTLRQEFDDDILVSQAAQTANTLQEALLRHLGSIDDVREVCIAELKNPFIWFREGIRALLSVPITLLVWFGVLSERTQTRITANPIFSILSAITAVVGFLSAIVSLILGWDEFTHIAAEWIAAARLRD